MVDWRSDWLIVAIVIIQPIKSDNILVNHQFDPESRNQVLTFIYVVIFLLIIYFVYSYYFLLYGIFLEKVIE